MAIEATVLGRPGRDNALWVRVDSGQQIHRILFDCGDGCVNDLGFSELRQTSALLFSHLHMDHVGGFDTFFRCNFDRAESVVQVWGPKNTSEVLHHRFQGFWWNLITGSPGEWMVHDVTRDMVESFRFLTSEAFAYRHMVGSTTFVSRLINNSDYSIDAITLNHGGPSLGFMLRESPRVNVAVERMPEFGLRPGPWLQWVKNESKQGNVEVDGVTYSLDKLRESLLVKRPGESIAYLTDFLLDQETMERLSIWLRSCDTVVCEAQYRNADLALAQRNHHTTVGQVARLASTAEVGRLVLFHLSDRYSVEEWREMLQEARDVFPATSFPSHFGID